MVGESNQNVFLIQIDCSSLAEFEISEFEITRVDCIHNTTDLYTGPCIYRSVITPYMFRKVLSTAEWMYDIRPVDNIDIDTTAIRPRYYTHS